MSGSGIANTDYKDGSNGTTQTGGVAVIAPPGSGSVAHTLYFWSVDRAGNIEYQHSVGFTVAAAVVTDFTRPVTVSSFNPSSGAIYNSARPVTLTPADAGGSGLKATYWRIDAGAYTSGTSFTVSGDGVHTFSYYSTDNANNAETPNVSNSFRLDTIAPVTTCSAIGNQTYTGSQTFSLTPADTSGSGVASTMYKLDSGAWTSGISVGVPAPGSGSVSHTISWYSTDIATNQESTTSVTFTVSAGSLPDTTPPVTSSNFNPSSGAIFNAAQPVTLSALDAGGSGIKATYWRVDGGTYASGTSFAVSGDGLHTLSYYSADNADNTETVHVSNQFRIDTVAPVTTCSAASGQTYTGSQTFGLAGTDVGGSGVAGTHYRLDTGAWTVGTSVSVPAPASGSVSHTIYWYSVDNATNSETQRSVTFSVAAAGPTSRRRRRPPASIQPPARSSAPRRS